MRSVKMDSNSHGGEQSKIKVNYRTYRSFYMFLLQHIVKIFNTQLIKPGEPFPAGSPQLEPHKSIRSTCTIKERQVEGIYIYDIHANESGINGEAAGTHKKRQLFYFAGGGWQMPPSSEHWKFCAELARKLPDISISVVSYPLAPISPAPTSFPMMLRMYRRLLEDAAKADEGIILAGDSAGANIVLCLAAAALAGDEQGPAPKAVLAMSPSCDLRRENPEIKVLEKDDPILRIPFIKESANKWRGDWDATDPRVSPLMADLGPLARRGVKIHGVYGRYDILSADAILFREKCEKAGVEGEWLDWKKQMHVFPLTWPYKLPEGVEAKDWMLDVLRRS